MSDDDLLTAAEAAAILGATRQHVHVLIARGELPTVEVMEPARRVRRADVERLALHWPRKPGRPRTAPSPAAGR